MGRGRGRRRCCSSAPSGASSRLRRGLEDALPRPGVKGGRSRGGDDEGGDAAGESESEARNKPVTHQPRAHRIPARAPVRALEDAAPFRQVGAEESVPRRGWSGSWGRGRGRRRCTWTVHTSAPCSPGSSSPPVRALEDAAARRPRVEGGRGRGVEGQGEDGARGRSTSAPCSSGASSRPPSVLLKTPPSVPA